MVEQLEEWQLEDKQSIQVLDVGENINCLKPSINIKYLCRKFILVVKTLSNGLVYHEPVCRRLVLRKFATQNLFIWKRSYPMKYKTFV